MYEFKPVSTTQALYIFECTKIQFFDNSLPLSSRSHFSGVHTARLSPTMLYSYVSYEIDTVQQRNGEKIVIFHIGTREKLTHTHTERETDTNTYTRSVCVVGLDFWSNENS